MAHIDLKQATIYLVGGGTGEEMEIKVGEGDINWTESRPIEYTLDRGRLDEVREGDETPMDVSFSFTWEYISASSSLTTGSAVSGTNRPLTIEDVLKNRCGWVSSDSDQCRPFAVDIKIIYNPTCATVVESSIETIILPDFRYESLEHNLKDGTISVSGKCNALEALSARSTPGT